MRQSSTIAVRLMWYHEEPRKHEEECNHRLCGTDAGERALDTNEESGKLWEKLSKSLSAESVTLSWPARCRSANIDHRDLPCQLQLVVRK